MLSFFTSNKWLFEIMAIIAIVSGIFYGINKVLKYEYDLGHQKATEEYAHQKIQAEKAARVKESELNKQLEEARNAAQLRDQKIDDLSKSLAITSNGLLDTIAKLRNQLSRDTPKTLRGKADTALSLFGECQERYREMAENADRHASDVRLLQEAP